ncbi:NAD(P)H-dependent oxidoreductase [Halomonas coralii]|uniref:NAD(P)H-dependent oxidoreductase n=1 Tax=Modicisalibacter sp. R2A 31.J TaxID=2831898 RepID=UPI001CCC6144|nr:NAD(P)H-dependent oxidoreductase [Modicisalibacter sp. R2A 31.J]MBZ9557326.1 NAD(P)H-dependent oxidoreductase [Modicisalibacter sp. R2A 31.J]
MSASKIVGLTGVFHRQSRTASLVSQLVSRAQHQYRLEAGFFTLADAGPSLGVARSPTDLDDTAQRLITEIRNADVLVVGVPTYNSSYPGMFKHLLDLMEPDAFAGKPVILAATGGSERHAMMIDFQLRPLFNYFKARTLTTGIFATPQDFTGDAVAAPILQRMDAATAELAPWLRNVRREEPTIA